jgi:hypothetical protein
MRHFTGLKTTGVCSGTCAVLFAPAAFSALISQVRATAMLSFLFLSHVHDREKDAFRDFVVHRMIEETKQEDGRCFETFRRINVSAAI